VQAIDVHREFKNCVVTFWVMSQFLHFLGASRGCADFRDPTAVFRVIGMEKEGVWDWIVGHYIWVQVMIERRLGLPSF
jgi:hypothetical protein